MRSQLETETGSKSYIMQLSNNAAVYEDYITDNDTKVQSTLFLSRHVNSDSLHN